MVSQDDKRRRLIDNGWMLSGDGWVLDISDSIKHTVNYITFTEGTPEENTNAAWRWQCELEAREKGAAR